MLPLAGVYVAAETRFISLNANNLLLISAFLLAVDVILFYLNRATFRREEIPTRWKRGVSAQPAGR